MSTPFSFTGSLNLPGDVGLPNDSLQIAMSSAYDSRADAVLSLSGAGTKSVPFGSVTMAKGVLIKVDATAASPVTVRVNSSVTGQIEIAPGGFLALGSPSPSAGITSLDIVYTADAVVRVWVLG